MDTDRTRRARRSIACTLFALLLLAGAVSCDSANGAADTIADALSDTVVSDAAVSDAAVSDAAVSDAAVSDTGGGIDISPSPDAPGAPDVTTDIAEDAASVDTGPPPGAEREVVVTTIHRVCIGCDAVSVCGRPPISDSTALSFDAAPNNDLDALFAAGRYELAGRSLPVDTCHFFDGPERDAIIDAPSSVQTLDAGDLTLGGAMPLLASPLVLEFGTITHNYPSLMRPVTAEGAYVAGADLTLDAAGGPDVSPFALTRAAPETLEILTPHTDEAGKIANIATDAPLDITWSGGAGFDTLVIALLGEYCQVGPETLVLCNVANDGAFTVPLDALSPITWPNAVELMFFASHGVAIDAPELSAGAAWSVRSLAATYVYWDEAAAPPTQTCDGDHMDEGFVGRVCSGDQDCGGGCCLLAVDVYFAGNYCTLLGCETDADCPADAACVEQANPFLPIDDYCGARCATNDDCRFPDYACLPIDGGTTVCRPNFW